MGLTGRKTRNLISPLLFKIKIFGTKLKYQKADSKMAKISHVR